MMRRLMARLDEKIAEGEKRPPMLKTLSLRALPFADAASPDFPLAQLLRLSLFQVSVGMATVMLLGTLNRVMIVELSIPAMLVAAMIALPVLSAPFRALFGFRSDSYRSAIGWKRIPFLWFGSLWQFGGLAIMPFALIVLSGDKTHDVPFAGEVLAALAFIMTGVGMHMTQTAGLALASDRATDETRPRVVALLYVMFLLGMAVSAVVIGWLLRDFEQITLVRVVQGTAVATLVLNCIALWKQESVRPMSRAEREAPRPLFRDGWADYMRGGQAGRLLAVVFLGALAFNMQDVLLEPYGGQVLGLSVSATTMLTFTWAMGSLIAFAMAARWLARGMDPYRMAGRGCLAGLAAFAMVILAAPMQNPALFYAGAALIGWGGGLFGVATLTAAMLMPVQGLAGRGLALGAWGAAQATGAGLAIFIGGALRDAVNAAALSGGLGEALNTAATGYGTVYVTEIALLFLTLMVLGPLVRAWGHGEPPTGSPDRIGLAELPS
jgi:BCD family chlorophyll transporter-like MFS transporter